MTAPSTSGPGAQLRDARLHLALEHAPDAQALPTEATRKAINKIAINSIQVCREGQKSDKFSWWKRVWDQLGTPRSPWSAALATVLLGGIITLLWHGQEVPDAAPDQPSATAPAPTLPTVATPKPATAVAPAAITNAASERARASQPAADATALMEQAPAPSPAPVPAAKAMAAAPAPAAPAVALRAAANEVAAPDWTAATVQMNGKTATLTGEQIRALAEALTTLIRRSNQAADTVPAEPATLRLTLGTSLGEQSTLDLWPQVLRWQAGGRTAQIRMADASSAQALLALAGNLLPP